MSTSLGFLVLNKKQERSYFNEIAMRAIKENIEVYIFTPADIQPNTELVNGLKFDNEKQEWFEESFSIPTFIYDRCFYPSHHEVKKYAPIISWLKTGSYFLGNGLPNKLELYQRLKDHPVLSHYLLESFEATSSEQVVRYLRQNKHILLKPINGAQGKGIISLQVKQSGIEMKIQRHKKPIQKIFSKKDDFHLWIKKLLKSHPFLIQPYLPLKDEENYPFDIRILLQKNRDGEWSEQGRGIRKGLQNSIISNLNGGGSVFKYNDWIKQLPQYRKILIEDEIKTIINTLPHECEKLFRPLFEIGIDIGIAQDGSTWILDINSKPGHKVILSTNAKISNTIFQAPVNYCKFLELTSQSRS